jgi:UDP-N-acetylglucosamine 2-epimerase
VRIVASSAPPQLIKAAALRPALRARHEDVFVDTGQHYDEEMAGVFFAELGLPQPDHVLGLGGGSQAGQTARMLAALEPILVAGPTRSSFTATRTRPSRARWPPPSS